MATKKTVKVVEAEADPFDLDTLLADLDPDARVKVESAIEDAPAFKPAKALRVGAKENFKLAVVTFGEMAREQRDADRDGNDMLVAQINSQMVRMVDTLLEEISVRPGDYITWSSDIDAEFAGLVLVILFMQQASLLGKSEPSEQS